MNAHHEQIADYFDPATLSDVTEVRCTVCNVVVDKITHRDLRSLVVSNNRVEIHRRIRDAWQRHSAPPSAPDYQI